jgi:hypothetical protein
MKFKDRPRPSGDAARVLWTTYDVSLNPVAGMGTRGAKHPINDGYDWNLGTPSKLGQLPYSSVLGLDGNLFYTVNNPNPEVTIGKVDTRTAVLKYLTSVRLISEQIHLVRKR